MVQAMKFFVVKPPPLSVLPLLGPHVLLRVLFLNTFSLYSSINVRDGFMPYSAADNIVSYIIIRNEKQKILGVKGRS